MYDENKDFRSVVEKLSRAQRVVVLTGAGISAESGVPTFRDAGGLWQRYRPEDLATPEAFRRDPQLVWAWYNWRRQRISQTSPNPGHHALAELERLVPFFALVTQNVDGLHRRAGSRNVRELHGNIMRNICIQCNELTQATVQNEPELVYCGCGGLLRPDVVWFGEPLPRVPLEEAVDASEAADVMLSVGTSSLVYPAASLPLIASQAGAYVVEINPEATPLSSRADAVLRGKAGEIVPRVVQSVAARVAGRPNAPTLDKAS